MAVIAPYDKGALAAIEKAIRDSDLGRQPDQRRQRSSASCFPQLTEERRRELHQGRPAQGGGRPGLDPQHPPPRQGRPWTSWPRTARPARTTCAARRRSSRSSRTRLRRAGRRAAQAQGSRAARGLGVAAPTWRRPPRRTCRARAATCPRRSAWVSALGGGRGGVAVHRASGCSWCSSWWPRLPASASWAGRCATAAGPRRRWCPRSVGALAMTVAAYRGGAEALVVACAADRGRRGRLAAGRGARRLPARRDRGHLRRGVRAVPRRLRGAAAGAGGRRPAGCWCSSRRWCAATSAATPRACCSASTRWRRPSARRSPGRASPARPLACALGGALMVPLLLHGTWWQGVLFGLAVVAAATLGDLGESMIKRDLGIKDMGNAAARPRRPDGPARLAAAGGAGRLAAADRVRPRRLTAPH